jgi:hypothetical protein
MYRVEFSFTHCHPDGSLLSAAQITATEQYILDQLASSFEGAQVDRYDATSELWAFAETVEGHLEQLWAIAHTVVRTVDPALVTLNLVGLAGVLGFFQLEGEERNG